MTAMTHSERCRAAIEGRAVDRAPRYIPGMACDVASRILGRRVNMGTGSLHYAETQALMQGEAAHREFEEKLFEDLADLNRALDVDVYRMPWRQTSKPAMQLDEYTFVFGDPDGDHSIARYAPESGDFGTVESVRKTQEPPEARLRRSVERTEAEWERTGGPAAQIADEHRRICARFGEEFFVPCNGGGFGVGIDAESLMLVATERDLVRRNMLLRARSAAALGRALAETPLPRVLVAGSDMAGNDGPFYSPATFRAVMLPALKLATAELAEVGVHYIFRSDGNLWAVADMLFAEAGCPGYGEVDRDATMTVGALRARYPELVIWNNFSSAKLRMESAAWVREEARRCVEESGGTRYFHGASNAILRDTPVENVEVMFGV